MYKTNNIAVILELRLWGLLILSLHVHGWLLWLIVTLFTINAGVMLFRWAEDRLFDDNKKGWF